MALPRQRFSSVFAALALTAAAVAAVAACGGGGTKPNDGNDGGKNNGPVGAVIVGNDFFQSSHNGTKPAVDTIPANTAVTWTWTNTGTESHAVHSLGEPSFTDGDIQEGDGKTTVITFTAPGTYRYNCTVHGDAMSGRIVVR